MVHPLLTVFCEFSRPLGGSCSSPLLGVCQQKCEDVDPGPGYHCVCRSGYEISGEDSHYCDDINECAVFGKCSQKCENFKGGFKCSCYDSYQLSHNNNKTICKIKGMFVVRNSVEDGPRFSLDISMFLNTRI